MRVKAGLAESALGKTELSQTYRLSISTLHPSASTTAPSDMSPIPSTPEAFRQFAREDSKRWGDAVRISGFKANES